MPGIVPDPQRRILVTGARGFIGRECLTRLRALDAELHAVSTQPVSDADGVRWHQCDLLDTAAAAEVLRRTAPSHLLHLAWIAEPGVFWESPLNRRWLAASAALFEAFYTRGGRRVVATGSCAEYAPATVPHIEDVTPVGPDTLYGETKVAACSALQAAARGRGTWAWLRLFFPYGPGEAAARFIPAAIDALLRGKPLDCTSGTQVRDFVHVRDVADACARAVESERSGVFNVGTGRAQSFNDVAHATVNAIRRGRGEAELTLEELRAAEAIEYVPFPAQLVGKYQSYTQADVKALRGVGYEAPFLTVEEGVGRYVGARLAAEPLP